jgi:hypothetical protein
MSHEEIMSDMQSPNENNRLDLVNVVRCKDCKDWHEYPDKKWGCCRREYWDDDGMFHLNLDTSSDDYCSYGERRDDKSV